MIEPPPRLNHLSLCVRDVQGVTAILTQHFGFEPEEQTSNYSILHGADKFFVVITRIDDDHAHNYPPDFHIGFRLDSHQAVHLKHRALLDAGFAPLELTSFFALDASWTAFYLPIGDGAQIEVNARTAI